MNVPKVVLVGIVLVAMVIGYFGGVILQSKLSFGNYNTVELIGNITYNSKVVLDKNQIQIKVSSIHYTPDGLLQDKNGVSVLGISRDIKNGTNIIVDISDDNLNYANSGALVDLICKEDGEKIFNCEYKIEPKQLCPIPTPTPKPTAKPKATAKPAVKK